MASLAKRRRFCATAMSSLQLAGGEEEDRTPDLRIANAALSQLSYLPNVGRILAHSNFQIKDALLCGKNLRNLLAFSR